ncbi:MAG: hypothetical protein AAF755_08265 [Pseudomonadota bacterium]
MGLIKRNLMGIALAVLFPLSTAAAPYEAPNSLKVFPLTSGGFEVVEARGQGAMGIWCAASSYVIDRLSPPGRTRLYVKTARGPSVSVAGRKGVAFTIDPADLSVTPSTSHSVSVRQVGRSLPIYHAVQFCREDVIKLEEILFRH